MTTVFTQLLYQRAKTPDVIIRLTYEPFAHILSRHEPS